MNEDRMYDIGVFTAHSSEADTGDFDCGMSIGLGEGMLFVGEISNKLAQNYNLYPNKWGIVYFPSKPGSDLKVLGSVVGDQYSVKSFMEEISSAISKAKDLKDG